MAQWRSSGAGQDRRPEKVTRPRESPAGGAAEHRRRTRRTAGSPAAQGPRAANTPRSCATTEKRVDAEGARRSTRAEQAMRRADRRTSKRGSPRCEAAIRDIENDDGRARVLRGPRPPPSRSSIATRRLMWQVGDLMHQWEELARPSRIAPHGR